MFKKEIRDDENNIIYDGSEKRKKILPFTKSKDDYKTLGHDHFSFAKSIINCILITYYITY